MTTKYKSKFRSIDATNNSCAATQFEFELTNLLAKHNVILKAEDYFHGYGNCVRGVRIVATGGPALAAAPAGFRSKINIDLGNKVGTDV